MTEVEVAYSVQTKLTSKRSAIFALGSDAAQVDAGPRSKTTTPTITIRHERAIFSPFNMRADSAKASEAVPLLTRDTVPTIVAHYRYFPVAGGFERTQEGVGCG